MRILFAKSGAEGRYSRFKFEMLSIPLHNKAERFSSQIFGTMACANDLEKVDGRAKSRAGTSASPSEHHQDDVRNEFETFPIDTNWQEDAATTDLVVVMREYTGMVRVI